MKISSVAVLLCATLCLAGCLSTEVSQSEVCGTEHIFASDYGWKLFNWIPIFRTDITAERVQAAVAAEANRRGKTVADLSTHTFERVMFDMPMLYITVPIPYVFCYREIQVSGVLQ